MECSPHRQSLGRHSPHASDPKTRSARTETGSLSSATAGGSRLPPPGLTSWSEFRGPVLGREARRECAHCSQNSPANIQASTGRLIHGQIGDKDPSPVMALYYAPGRHSRYETRQVCLPPKSSRLTEEWSRGGNATRQSELRAWCLVSK